MYSLDNVYRENMNLLILYDDKLQVQSERVPILFCNLHNLRKIKIPEINVVFLRVEHYRCYS